MRQATATPDNTTPSTQAVTQSLRFEFEPDALLTAEQISLFLDCSVHTVYRLWKSGKLAKHANALGRARSTFADVQALGWIPQHGKVKGG